MSAGARGGGGTRRRLVAVATAVAVVASTLWLSGTSLPARSAPVGTTERESVSSSGSQGGEPAVHNSISADGRWVAFSTTADLRPPGSPRLTTEQVYVHDRQTGVTTHIAGGACVHATEPSISGDGNTVAYTATYDSCQDQAGWDQHRQIWAYDRDPASGSWETPGRADFNGNNPPAARRVSVGPGLLPLCSNSSKPSISGFGRVVAFLIATPSPPPIHALMDRPQVQAQTTDAPSCSSALVPASGHSRVLVHDRDTSGGQNRQNYDIATDTFAADGAAQPPNGQADTPAVSATASTVAFASTATDLPGNEKTNSAWGVYVRDLRPGAPLVQVSVRTAPGVVLSAPSDSVQPTISADGRFVGFASDAPNLVDGDTNGVRDVFLHDRWVDGNAGRADASGNTATKRISIAPDGSELRTPSGEPALSGDGRTVAFTSLFDPGATSAPTTSSTTARPPQQGGTTDGPVPVPMSVCGVTPKTPGKRVFAADRIAGHITDQVSLSVSGANPDGPSECPSISSNGRYVAFDSDAQNLLAPGQDTNGVTDVFVRERQPVIDLHPPVDFGPQDVEHTATACVDSSGASNPPATSDPCTVTATNTGTGPAVVSGLEPLSGPDRGDFAIVDTTCPLASSAAGGPAASSLTLYPGERCVVRLSFTPHAVGARSAVLTLDDDAAPNADVLGQRVQQTDALTGTGRSGPLAQRRLLTLRPPVDFGDQPTNSPSVPRAVTVANTGDLPVDVNGFQVAGADASQFFLTWTGASGECPVPPMTLRPGERCTLSVVFAPTAPGRKMATLDAIDNAEASPQQDPLTGNGASGPPVGDRRKLLSVAPVPVDFGPQQLGEAAGSEAVTVTSVGQAPVALSTITIGGAAARDFGIDSQSCAGRTLAPLESCTINLRFVPSALGPREASLDIADDAAGAPHRDPLVGTGTQVPPPPPQPCAGRLSVSPLVAVPGSVVSVRGGGWPVGQTITVRWDHGIADTRVVPNGDRFETQLLVFRRDTAGTRSVVATGPGLTCTEPVLVEPGAMEPPKFLIRH